MSDEDLINLLEASIRTAGDKVHFSSCASFKRGFCVECGIEHQASCDCKASAAVESALRKVRSVRVHATRA